MSSCYLSFNPSSQKPSIARKRTFCQPRKGTKSHISNNIISNLQFAQNVQRLPSIAKNVLTLTQTINGCNTNIFKI
jgi:hypothetical protein